ncbi:MAG: hypothetical protein HOV81_43165 [Kofleriaceae bacterium]|nr:hypothetical protein [Kofleriaceae bacterium]
MRAHVLVAAAATIFASACTIEDPTTSTTDEALSTWNRLAQNRLAQNRLAQNRLAQNRLAQNSLNATSVEALHETARILETEGGREMYSYLINCALNDGTTVEANVPTAQDTAPPNTLYTCTNHHCVFPGALGLAEEWRWHKLSPKGQGWVSACIFSRVNAHTTTEAISLRGRHSQLAITPDEGELFPLEEGAFYGNLFVDEDQEIDWNACRGEAQAASEDGGLDLRDCTEEDPARPGFTQCGFKYAGDCRDYTPEFPSPYACRTYNSGFYGDCAGVQTADDDDDDDNDCGHHHDNRGWSSRGHKYREVITVYVSN